MALEAGGVSLESRRYRKRNAAIFRPVALRAVNLVVARVIELHGEGFQARERFNFRLARS